MNKSPYPFVLIQRKDKNNIYYVMLKADDGSYSKRKSTGTKDKKEAIKIALQWYRDGVNCPVPTKKRNELAEMKRLEYLKLLDKIHKSDFTSDEVTDIMDELKRRGFIGGYALRGSVQDINAYDFLLNFWNYEKSPYIKEKLRKGHKLGKRHTIECEHIIENDFQDFKNKNLADITRNDILQQMDRLDTLDIANSTKTKRLRTLITPLRWAYVNEYMDKDVTREITFYSYTPRERVILTPEMAQAIFSVKWNDNRAKLANLLAMCTGMRAGEITALQLKDLGENCIYVNHSWNCADGLKSTKNGEARIAYLPFPEIINALKELAYTNPFEEGLDGFIFYATIPTKPIETYIFIQGLREALISIGINENEAKKYTFHAWRHYFATYMKDRVADKILQQQTGHKTLAMLEHYANHETERDVKLLENAQISNFGDIVKSATFSFDKKQLWTKLHNDCVDKTGLYEHSHQRF